VRFARRPDGVLVGRTSENVFAFLDRVAAAVAARGPVQICITNAGIEISGGAMPIYKGDSTDPDGYTQDYRLTQGL